MTTKILIKKITFKSSEVIDALIKTYNLEKEISRNNAYLAELKGLGKFVLESTEILEDDALFPTR